MATTSPNNISYPTNADAQKTIENRIQDTANSVQTALNTKANLAGAAFTGNVEVSASGTLINGSNGTSIFASSSSGKVPVTAKGASGQTANLQEWQNSSAGVLSSVNASGQVIAPAIGLGGITAPGHKLDSNGRIKLRSDGGSSSGCWFTGNDGTETVFFGQLGNTSSDAIGIYHTGAWRFYTTATLTTLINDTEVQRWRGHLDRSWDNYPSITIFNTTDKGPQGEFRLHGYPGSNGGDYSIVMRSDGGYVSGSDARRKSNIEDISDALSTVCQLSGKRFNIVNSEGTVQEDLSYEDTGKKFGFLGQEAIEVIPEAVKFYPEADEPNEIGYASAYSVDYASVVPLLVEAIKELSAKVTELESKLPPS